MDLDNWQRCYLRSHSPIWPFEHWKWWQFREILDFHYVTNHKTLLLHHNFTIHPSTGVYESRILSSIYYYELLILVKYLMVWVLTSKIFPIHFLQEAIKVHLLLRACPKLVGLTSCTYHHITVIVNLLIGWNILLQKNKIFNFSHFSGSSSTRTYYRCFQFTGHTTCRYWIGWSGITIILVILPVTMM